MSEKHKLAEAGQRNNKLWKRENRIKSAFVLVALAVLSACAAAQENPTNTAGYWLEKGYNLTADGYYEEAVQAFDKVLQIDPENYTALINKGHAIRFEAFDTYNKALEITNRTLEKNPQDAQAWQGKGAALSGLGSNEDDQAYARAVEVLDQYTNKDPKNASAWWLKGENYANMHKVEEALKAYDKVIELNYTPKLAVAWMSKTVLLAELQRYGEALNASSKAIELSPKSASAWASNGYILKALGRTADADAAFTQAKELGYETAYPARKILTITNVTTVGKDKFLEIINERNETQSFKNWSLVDGENKSILLPDFALEPGQKLRIHFGEGKSNKSDLFLSAGFTLKETAGNLTLKDPSGGYRLFMSYWEPKVALASRNGSKIEFDVAHSRRSVVQENTTESWLKKGYELVANGSYKQALQAYDEAIKLDPDNKTAWINKAVALEGLDRHNEAIEAYGNALEIVNKTLKADPRDADAWSEKGLLLHNVGKYEDAVEAFDNATAADPKNEMAWKMKGIILSSELHRYNESIIAFDSALQIDPRDASVWSLKGDVLKVLGRSSEANAAYAKANDLSYKVQPCAATLAITNITTGEDKFIEITNSHSEPRNLKNWTLAVNINETKSAVLPDLTLAPNEMVRVHFCPGNSTKTDIYLNDNLSINTAGGAALINEAGKMTASLRYETVSGDA